MSITATEFKTNLGKYLMLAATEDIFISKNGKIIAKLTNPNQDRVDMCQIVIRFCSVRLHVRGSTKREVGSDMRAFVTILV